MAHWTVAVRNARRASLELLNEATLASQASEHLTEVDVLIEQNAEHPGLGTMSNEAASLGTPY